MKDAFLSLPWRALIPLVLLAVLTAIRPAVADDVPDLPHITVMPCDLLNGVVLAPDQPDPVAATVVQFSIRNWNNEPIRDPVVVFEPGPGLRFCVGMGFSTIGDEEGRATMVLRGAGCLQDVSGAARFRANGVIIRDYRNAKSPDWDGSGANGQVDLADLVRFSSFTDSCFDFNNNGGIDLGDTIIFTNGFSPAHRCQLQ